MAAVDSLPETSKYCELISRNGNNIELKDGEKFILDIANKKEDGHCDTNNQVPEYLFQVSDSVDTYVYCHYLHRLNYT